MVLDFIKWCESNKLPLPTVDENTKRAGLSQEYPSGYVRSQYPDAYFAPVVATAYLDLKNAKGKKDVKGGKDSAI